MILIGVCEIYPTVPIVAKLIPFLARVAGFEWGTGFYINPISPEESIQVLKAV